jgi:putative heme-binding domain-containing protein
MSHRILPALVTLIALSGIGRAAGPEPWADPKLPVRDGVELWLDASRLAGDKPAPADGKVATWLDGSGHGRHLRQETAAARPAVMAAGGTAVVRFDGEGTHLRAVKQGAELKTFTIFAVTAPRQNPGAFRGLMAFNKANERDYQSGLTIDLGPFASPRLTTLNVEGRGFGGAVSLRKCDDPFGGLHTLEVSADAKAVRLAVDGKPEGGRPRTGEPVSLDEITVGARYYNNGPGPQHVDGYCRCDLAEVLVYDRVLSAADTAKVRDYLGAKYAGLKAALPPDPAGPGESLVPMKDPPPVQVFLPGFTVRELPVDLTNINNIQYRPDGTLVALGYDGRVWLLRDTNGDGLEDKAELFWDGKGNLRSPIGMDLTPPGYKLGQGLVVAAKGKCSLIVDTNGDGKADKEIVIAEGWKELPHGVDALGAAFDRRDGSIYFGLGTTDYTNAYQVGRDGKAGYSLKDERGTILRIAPDLKSREIVATGIRFPVAIRFNKLGDLFCTDQEGATWLPNGNPLDELLHIQKGRHYGFPPRHPKYLPNVIDEPSTFDYGPQHQSTCGLNFNGPVKPDGPTFGPKAWAGDAFVTGYSRGKLYRTKLVKTPAGYVGQTQLLACLNMLAVDACVAPDGSLLVACHSGGPDWGSGPTGKGKLFKIAYTDRDHPQPVFAWPAGPREVRVEFDRPVDPQLLRDIVGRAKLTAGKYVRAGDRFESLWPGYAVVQMQKAAPRFDVPIRSAQLTPDRRTLILATDPHSAAVHHALTLPGMGRPPADQRRKGTLPQLPAIDLDFDLSGCEVTWTPSDGGPSWIGWLPHLDLQVARELTAGSAVHDQLWEAIKHSGTLTLKAQLNLTDMLRPAVQPGSRLDYELPPEKVTLGFDSSCNVDVESPLRVGIESRSGGGGSHGTFWFRPVTDRTIPIEIRLTNNSHLGGPQFSLTFFTNEDKRPRPLQLHRILVPWADTNAKALDQPAVAVRPKELDGGSWARGRKVFFGEQAACSKCHAINGRGGDIGPDLSNLVHRDYPSVLRDIEQPSFAINPDHLTYVIHLKDGRTLTGVVKTAGDRLRIGDTKGIISEIAKDDVEEMTPSAVSTMPEGMPKELGPERMRDLMTFLLTEPSMPRDLSGPRPKPRPAAEVRAALAGAPEPPEKTQPIRVVLVAGPKDHGPGEHDYPAWQKAWAELLAAADHTEVATAWEWPAADEFRKADVMVFFQHGNWDAKRAADVDAFLERGGGLVYVHWAVDGQKGGPEFAKRIGLAAVGAVGFRHGPLELRLNKESRHPVLRNLEKLALTDETYWKMVGDLPADRILGTAVEDGKPQPQMWSLERGRGRVFVSIPGHYSWTFDDPLFRLLLLRGIAWAAKEPVDRFNELVWPGADVAR